MTSNPFSNWLIPCWSLSLLSVKVRPSGGMLPRGHERCKIRTSAHTTHSGNRRSGVVWLKNKNLIWRVEAWTSCSPVNSSTRYLVHGGWGVMSVRTWLFHHWSVLKKSKIYSLQIKKKKESWIMFNNPYSGRQRVKNWNRGDHLRKF